MVHRSKQAPAFHFCKNLFLLLATCNDSNQCASCHCSTTYLAYDSSLVRKRRPPKPREVTDATRPCRPKPVAFTIANGRTAKHKKHSWTADSGCTLSVTNRIDLFETIDDAQPRKRVRVANGDVVDVVCTGTIRLQMSDSTGKPYTVLHSNVAYSPKFSSNLLSIHELHRQHGISTTFRGNKASFHTPDDVEIPISFSDSRQYILHANAATELQSSRQQAINDRAALWHKRFMHCGNAALRRMAHVIPGITGFTTDFSKCDACLQGKGRQKSFGNTVRRPQPDSSYRRKQTFTYYGERVASDLIGPFPAGQNGHKYAITFYDCYSKHISVYTLPNKEKETVLEVFQQFLIDNEASLPYGVKHFWTDNGSEYLNSDMEKFCHEICVRRSYSIPYTPQQNPYAERCNGDLLCKTRSAFADSGANEKYWPDVIKHAALIHNVLLNENGTSPHELKHGKPFDYSTLHVILCMCHYLLPHRDRASKLSPRSLPAIYLGPDDLRNGHLVYVPKMQRYTSSYHLVFNEHRYYDKSVDRTSVTFADPTSASNEDTEDTIATRLSRRFSEDSHVEHDSDRQTTDLPSDTRPADDPVHGTVGDGTDDPGVWNANHCPNSQCKFPRGHDGPCSHQIVHGPRNRRQTVYAECVNENCCYHSDHCGACYGEDSDDDSDHDVAYATGDSGEHFKLVADDVCDFTILVNLADMQDIPEPKSYDETQRSPLRERWNASMREEWEALLKNGTFEFVSRNDPRVRNRKPTKSRWVYKLKLARDGTIERFKSRFVVCGYSQRHGIDYDRAFSATLRATSFRTLLAIASGRKMRLMHFDVSNAFTQADMDEHDVFIDPPKGFEDWELVNGKRVSKLLYLKRALYGTKQASRLWQETLCTFLLGLGFVRSTADPCLFRLVDGESEILLGIYVDDIIVAYRGSDIYERFHKAFFNKFPGKPEKLAWFLGMAIDQHEDYSIHLDHDLAISKLADKFIPNNTVTREFPSVEAFTKLDRAQSDLDRVRAKRIAYSSLVGALLYIAVMSRPDIAAHTSILAKFLADPSPECVDAAIILLQYLHATRKKKLYYSGKIVVPDGLERHSRTISQNYGFVAYSDSSWGNKYPYPMFGYGVYLYGGLVSFASKQLKTVAFSSCEAEYAAASFACKEIEFIRQICRDMGVQFTGSLVLSVDNTAAIDVANDIGVSGRTKHFDRAIHYVRDLTQLKRILPVFVNTFQQRADGYTKILDKSTFVKWVSNILH